MISPFDSSQVSQSLVAGKAQEVERYARRGELFKASQEFEAYFVSFLLKTMRDTVPQSSLTANRMGETFRSFYDEELGKRAAQSDGFGLSQYILASLSDNEMASRSPVPRT